MASNERKVDEREQRRETIINSAIELIEQKGFESTTMDEIAERADVSKGTLYLYFEDKSALHQSIKKKALMMLREKFHNIFKENITGAEVVRKMSLVFLDFILENKTFNRAMMLYEQSNRKETEAEDVSDDCLALENELFMLIVRGLQIGIQDKSVRSSVPPKILGLHLVFEMRGILMYYTAGESGIIPTIISEEGVSLRDVVNEFINSQLRLN